MLTVHSIRSTFRLMNFIVDFFLIYHIMFSDAPVFFLYRCAKIIFLLEPLTHYLTGQCIVK